MRKLATLLFVWLFAFTSVAKAQTAITFGAASARGFGFARTASVTYDADATALFARMTTPPSTTRKGQINTLIVALKAANIWTKFDAFYIFAAADSQAALLNWKGATYNATAANSPTFTADRGFNSDGSATASSPYVNTNYTPSASGSLNDAHLSYWAQNNNGISAGSYDGSQAQFIGSIFKINNNTNASHTAGTGPGLFTATRTASNLTTLYFNGVSNATSAAASTNRPTNPILVSAYNNGSNFPSDTARYAGATIGVGLSAADALALYNAMQAYMTAVGA